MRDLKQVLGVSLFLVALPAWASRMDLRPFLTIFLWPSYGAAIVACLVGLLVRSAAAARVWRVLLLLGAIPAIGAAMFFHRIVSQHVHTDQAELFGSLVFAILALIGSHVWAFWRIVVSLQPPETTPEGPQSA
jgi:hypothetical protein